MSYKIGFVSLGCPKNLTDTETMIGILEKEYRIVNDVSQADIIVVNTCSFINDAKEESVNTIIEMAEYKKSGLKYLVVTGCLAQRYSEDFANELPEVDAVVGTGSFFDIDKAIKALDKGKVTLLGSINDAVPEGLPRRLTTPKHYAYLKISEGCDNRCTYCVIPSIRGKYRSRAMNDISNEAKTLVAQGVKELVLIAQDTTRYGVDFGKPMLAELVEKISETDGLNWIRLLYCYPEMITDELIDLISNNIKVCKYLDIPIQHISGRILKLMGRKSSPETIRSLMEKLRSKIPNITIRSSLIVGFPGETQEDFEELLAFVKEGNFDRLGVFTYSEEEGTPAASMPNKVNEDVKAQRQALIMEEQRKISFDKNHKKQGKLIDVLCDGVDAQSGLNIGRGMGDAPEIDGLVYFSGVGVKSGDMVKVKITSYTEYDLDGEMVQI